MDKLPFALWSYFSFTSTSLIIMSAKERYSFGVGVFGVVPSEYLSSILAYLCTSGFKFKE